MKDLVEVSVRLLISSWATYNVRDEVVLVLVVLIRDWAGRVMVRAAVRLCTISDVVVTRKRAVVVDTDPESETVIVSVCG